MYSPLKEIKKTHKLSCLIYKWKKQIKYITKALKNDCGTSRHSVPNSILRQRLGSTQNNPQSLDLKGRLKTQKWEVEKSPYVELGEKKKNHQSRQEGFICLDCFPLVQSSRQTNFVESKSSSLSVKNFLFGDQHPSRTKVLCFG